MTTTIHSIKRSNGVAGQLQYTAAVQYDDEEPRTVSFIGSQFGGPVVMRTDRAEVFVSNPGRFGPFSEQWVRTFCTD